MSGHTVRRVLHVIRTDGVSGAERHLVLLVAGLQDHGWSSDVLMATPRSDGVAELVKLLRDAGAGVRTLRTPYDPSVRLLRAIRTASRSGVYDVIHSHLVHADWHTGLATHGTSRPILVSTKHNHDPFRTGRAFRIVERFFARRVQATIAISESLATFFEQWIGLRPHIVPYGLPAGPQPDHEPRNASSRTFLGVGRLEAQKGFDVLVQAVAQAHAMGADLRVVIAGEGSQRGALERQIQEAGLESCVELLGQRADVAQLMLTADALVHPARWEGFGLVLLEAMRAGLPIVASFVGAIPEVVEDGVTAVLVPHDDPLALATAMVQLADDGDHLMRMGEAGRRRLEAAFPPQLMAARTAAVYADAHAIGLR